jgi:thiol-disulfide isomerase/thioredoxin
MILLLKRYLFVGSLLGIILSAASLAACGSAEGGPTLMYFRASNCPYCKEMTPLVDEIRDAYGSRLAVVYATIDEPEGKELAHRHGIIGYPTMLLLNSDGEEVGVLRGVVPKTALEKMIDELLDQEE